MITTKTSDLIADFNKKYQFTDYSHFAEDTLVKLYTGIRLQKLVNAGKISVKQYNNLCDTFCQEYETNDISLDIMINALYNYINEYDSCPKDAVIKDIRAFLEDFSNLDFL